MVVESKRCAIRGVHFVSSMHLIVEHGETTILLNTDFRRRHVICVLRKSLRAILFLSLFTFSEALLFCSGCERFELSCSVSSLKRLFDPRLWKQLNPRNLVRASWCPDTALNDAADEVRSSLLEASSSFDITDWHASSAGSVLQSPSFDPSTDFKESTCSVPSGL